MNSLHMGQVGSKADVLEGSALSESLRLEVGAEVVERIAARIVVILIFPHEAAKCKHGIGADQAGPSWRNIKRLNLRALISRAERCPRDRVGQEGRQAQDWICVKLLIVRIRILKIRARILQVELNRIRIRGLEIHTIEKILFVTFV